MSVHKARINMCVFCFGSRHSITKQVIFASTVVGTRKDDYMYLCTKLCIGKSNSEYLVQIAQGDKVQVIKKLRDVVQVRLNSKQIVYISKSTLMSNFKPI